MKTKDKIAFYLYFFIGIISIVFGLRYLFCETIMPYHEQAIGMQWTELGLGLQLLLNGLIKVASAAFFIVGISSVILLLIPFRKGENWAKWSVPFIQIVFSGFVLYASLKIGLLTQASTPWPVSIVTLTISIIAFLLTIIPLKSNWV